MTASRFELPRSCIALAGLAILPAVGCFRMRASPPMAPHATGGVIQSQQSGGQLLGSAGASSDVLSSSSSDASLDGRLELGKHFDLGLGGAYGAGGLPKTWAGRLSPRWYLTGMHARSAVALELGVSAGQYPGGPVDFFTTPKAYRANFGSVDAPSRFGAALSADWEVFDSIGPYLSFAGRDACRTNGTSRFACRSRPYFNTGFMSDVGLQWTHPSGFTLGGQGSGSMGSAHLFGFNLDAGAVVTLGHRFGYVPRVFQEATHRQPESPCRPDCPAES